MLHSLAFIPQGQEWLIILVVVLVLFGGAKIPQLMRGLGRGVSEFQEGIRETKDKFGQGLRDAETPENKG